MRHELDFFRPSRWSFSRDREISDFQNGINRIFHELGWPTRNQETFGKNSSEVAFAPACDVEETEEGYLLSFDLPGVAKENIKVELNDHDLVVSGERKEERKESSKTRRFVERSYGSFYRLFTLPNAMSAERIHANFENGVLKISIPKTEATKTKQIPIGGVKPATIGKDVRIA